MRHKKDRRPPSRKRSKRSSDPFAQREAQKYVRPIASREAILQWLEQVGEPVSFERLLHELGLTEAVDVEALNRRLAAMLCVGGECEIGRTVAGRVKCVSLVAGSVIGDFECFGLLTRG